MRFLISCLIFLLSGIAALVYEISWMRQIGTVLGHTVHAAAVVLAAYFLGLALGCWLGGRWARRVSPLVGYAIAEAIAAMWAVLIPLLIATLRQPSIVASLGNSMQWHSALIQGAVCLFLLLPATTALGATLPFMAQYLSPQGRPAMRRTSIAYACNTIGALIGVALASVVLLVTIGVASSSYLAAGLSLFCGGLALLIHRTARNDESTTSVEQVASSTISTTDVSLDSATEPSLRDFCLAAVTGFATLSLQVLYMRLVSLVFHNSTYSFGIVITVFLAALALGALLVPFLLRSVKVESLLSGALLLAAFTTIASLWIFVSQTDLKYFRAMGGFVEYLKGATTLVGSVVFLPVLLAGMVLPSVWHANEQSSSGSGRTVGRLTMTNTLAAAAGSLVASFVMLPMLGLERSFVAIAFLLGGAAAVILFQQQRRLVAGVSLVLLALVSLPMCRSDGLAGFVPDDPKEQLVQRWNSPYGWIDVVRLPESQTLKVRQNLHYRYGGTGISAPRENRQAHLPLLLHPDPQETLFLGLGTGLTAAGAIPHEDVERITIVELIPEVVDAARLLSEGNFGVVDHPKVDMVVDDARHYLLATDRRFDVIVSDLFVPWESETGYLYTVEHYQRCREKLGPGGLFCQWLALYQLGDEEFRLIVNSFATAFPETTLWWGHLSPGQPIIAIIGSEQPLHIETRTFEQRIEQLRATDRFDDRLIDSPENLAALLIGRWQVESGALLNTEEYPRVEFRAPRAHLDGRLLRKKRLRNLVDVTFSQLPPMPPVIPQAERATSWAEDQRRRIANQKWILFGANE